MSAGLLGAAELVKQITTAGLVKRADLALYDAVLDGARMTDAIYLGWERVCEIDRSIACLNDGDCPASELCIAAAPELSFKHQLHLMNGEGGLSAKALDRALQEIE